MRNFLALSAALALSLGSAVTFSEPLPVTGLWRTVDDGNGAEKSVVQVYEQDGKIFGKIVSLTQPLDDEGKPAVCKRCEGADRNKPVVGLVIIKDLSLDGDAYSGGTVMDPETGKTYKCKLEAMGGGKQLKVRGFIGVSLLGRTQVWHKK